MSQFTTVETTTEVALGPQQWVGYWGHGHSALLSQSLRKLLPDSSVGWTLSAPSRSTEGNLAQLSASGLTVNAHPKVASADAWVRQDIASASPGVTLGREPFGRVPLYWMQRGQVLWFASRLQLLLPLLDEPKVNPAGLYGYSCFSYVPTPLTPVEAIAAIPAGTEQTWSITDSGQLVTSAPTQFVQTWQAHPETINDEATAIAQLQTRLKTAVERQITDLSDEPVGIFLSGGLDSSVVAALLVQAGVKVQAYTLDLGEHSVPEYPYAEQVAQWLDIPLTKVAASPQHIRPAIAATVNALDMPFGDGVTVPLYLLNQAASRDVRIIFNGEGGDQLFAGWTNKPLIAASIYQTEHPDGPQSFTQQYLRTFHRLWGYESQVFQPALLDPIQRLHAQDWLYPALDVGTTQAAASLLHRLRRASLMLKGAQNIHPRATNLAFAHGLQVRSPFCDPALTDWSFRLSGELCLQGACEKYILKRAVEDWLPPEIVWRQKRGMGVPLTAWCLKDYWSQLGHWLNPGMLQTEGHWQPDLAARVAFGELGGKIRGRRIGEILWLLVMWQLWRSHVLEASARNRQNNRSWNHPFHLPYAVWRFGKNGLSPRH